MKKKHTAGPWHRNIRAGGKYPVVFAGRNTHIAVVQGHRHGMDPEEIEANIDLIAAAPELLELLEQIVDAGYLDGAYQPLVESANVVLAKARGET